MPLKAHSWTSYMLQRCFQPAPGVPLLLTVPRVHAGNPARNMQHWSSGMRFSVDIRPHPADAVCQAFDEAVLAQAQEHPDGMPVAAIQSRQQRQPHRQQQQPSRQKSQLHVRFSNLPSILACFCAPTCKRACVKLQWASRYLPCVVLLKTLASKPFEIACVAFKACTWAVGCCCPEKMMPAWSTWAAQLRPCRKQALVQNHISLLACAHEWWYQSLHGDPVCCYRRTSRSQNNASLSSRTALMPRLMTE